MVDRVVAEAIRAASFLGLKGDVAEGYGARIRAILPGALDALMESDPVPRARKLESIVADVRRVSEEHRVPRMIERGLVSIAFGFARALIWQQGGRDGFTSGDLDQELVAFRDAFEATLAEAQ